jgi:hypothetical protein
MPTKRPGLKRGAFYFYEIISNYMISHVKIHALLHFNSARTKLLFSYNSALPKNEGLNDHNLS